MKASPNSAKLYVLVDLVQEADEEVKNMALVRNKTQMHFLVCELDCRCCVTMIKIIWIEAVEKAEA